MADPTRQHLSQSSIPPSTTRQATDVPVEGKEEQAQPWFSFTALFSPDPTRVGDRSPSLSFQRQSQGALQKKSASPGLQRSCWGPWNYPHRAAGPRSGTSDARERHPAPALPGAAGRGTVGARLEGVRGCEGTSAEQHPRSQLLLSFSHISCPSPTRSPTSLPATPRAS